MQFYRGMDIGTAKITVAERRGMPHHLLDILDVTRGSQRLGLPAAGPRRRSPTSTPAASGPSWPAAPDSTSAPRWTCWSSPAPTRPSARRLEAELEADGLAPLRQRLRSVDPVSAGRIGDARRVVRALEVYELTGRPFSSFMPDREYFQPAVQIGLDVDRELLQRAAGRAASTAMVDARAAGRSAAAGRRRACARAGRPRGPWATPQFLQVLDGESTAEQAAEETIVATRQFARRQLTWFRADPADPLARLAGPGLLAAAAAALAAVQAAGRTPGNAWNDGRRTLAAWPLSRTR